MKSAIIYVRVSTAGQAIDGISLEAQESKARSYCEAAGMDVAAVYTDAGISGKDMKHRPGLLAALEHTCKSKGALVAYSLSRLARSTRDALDIADRLDKAGADMVSLSEKIDTTSAAGKMVFRMLAVLAEFERDLTAERTTAALHHLKAQGKRISGHIPFGYDLNPETGDLIPNQVEQEAISLIRTMRAEGRTYQAIIEALEERGIRAKEGGKWHPSAIRNICRRAA